MREHGPFENAEDIQSVALLRSPLEPWRTGAMDHWEVAAFAEWLKQALG